MWSYYGRKTKVISKYPEPEYDIIIEPFAGTAVYSLYKDNWKKEVHLIEKYDIVVDLWHYLQNATKEDILKLPDMECGESLDKHKQLCKEERYLIGFCINEGSANPKVTASKRKTFNNWNKNKYKIAESLYKIKHWDIRLGNYNDFEDINNMCATWFIDPPYQFGGQYYRHKFDKYDELSEYCKTRKGQVIVCENTKAMWLPFRPLKKMHGQIHTTTEAIWTNMENKIDGGKQMSNYFDLHRHDETSFFDGFGKPIELAKRAKELGYTALGLSNHGNITGLVQHWLACKEVGIKPILGCEVYFQPKFNRENPQRKTYHLCLFAKNMEGYKNLCHIMTEANTEQFYYKPIVDFRMLEKHSEGLICSTACIASATSQAIVNGNIDTAGKLLDRFKSIFGKDLYVEIQPYKIDKKGTQQKTDYTLMKLARERKIKCILTSDSHFGSKEDFDTYCKMHEIGKTTLDVKNTYSERYMPSEYEIEERFAKIYKNKFKDAFAVAEMFVDNLKKLQDSVEDDILSQCELVLPKIETTEESSEIALRKMVSKGLKKRGKWNAPGYKKRCLEELEVIHYHGFDDYFLMVQDYVNWAREHGIAVGPGRGSACNCLVAYALGITDVDSIRYNLDFSRFMRKEKKKLPDIDVDFETARRQEVIDYVIHKYPGKAVQICSYGEYKIDNLINDLAGVCGLPTSGKEIDGYDKEQNKKIVSEIKRFIREYEEDGKLNMELLLQDDRTEEYNSQYDNIIKHFSKLFGKIRYLGKHAAGVAVVGSDISDYTAVVRKGDMFSSSYDLNDLEHINCTKFDMLGLKTMSELRELAEYTGHVVTDEDREEHAIYESFREGKTDGIFQMEKSAPKKILDMIQCDCIGDVIAVNALNRPAPLQLKMHETYAYNKLSGKVDTNTPYYKYTKETYGTMLYQEQTVEVAQRLGHLTPEQSFDLLKIMKKAENQNKPEYIPIIEQMKKDFFKGCRSEGLTKEQTKEIWASMLIYGFNKGHSTGYAIIAVDQMWYKLHNPAVFWYVKMRFAGNDADLHKYSQLAVKDGAVVMLPHVNYTARTSMRKMDGEEVIQQGLSIIKGVGDKAAQAIEQERRDHGVFKDYDDFYDRCKGRIVTSRVIDILSEQGALEFNKRRYLSRVVKYNSSLLGR